MVRVRADAGRSRDRGSFHRVSRAAMGVPGSDGDDKGTRSDGLLHPGAPKRFPVESGDVLVIEVTKSIGFRGRCPEQFAELVEGTACVGPRRIEEGLPPPLAPALA